VHIKGNIQKFIYFVFVSLLEWNSDGSVEILISREVWTRQKLRFICDNEAILGILNIVGDSDAYERHLFSYHLY